MCKGTSNRFHPCVHIGKALSLQTVRNFFVIWREMGGGGGVVGGGGVEGCHSKRSGGCSSYVQNIYVFIQHSNFWGATVN